MKNRLLRLSGRRRPWPTLVLIVAAGVLAFLAGYLIVDRTSPDEAGPETGVVPAEMPDDFPIPPEAELGTHSVGADPPTVTLELMSDGTVAEAVRTHTVGLVSAGYVVSESASSPDGWLIRFERLDMRGEIAIRDGGSEVISTITIVDPG